MKGNDMSKRLTITYGGITIYDDEPGQFSWSEAASGGIKLEAGPQRQKPAVGLVEQLTTGLTNVSKARTAKQAEELGNGAHAQAESVATETA